jgi:hypothetical protein
VKKILTAMILLSFAVTAAARIPIEKDAQVDREALARAPDVLDESAVLIRAAGYRCDSISRFRPMFGSRGFVLSCNDWSYKYEIEDRGGRWTVKLM